MQEKFDEWNEIKKQINSSQTLKYPSVGKIYWCSVGYNVGREVYGKGDRFRRPVLVLNVLPNKMFLVSHFQVKPKTKQVLCFISLKIIKAGSKWYFWHRQKAMILSELCST